MYEPKPIDTSRVTLHEHIVELTEKLAEDVHDRWAARRLADGWTHGPRRDDRRKLHPNLVPYAALSEADKEYDRTTALGALKAILALGYRIQPGGR